MYTLFLWTAVVVQLFFCFVSYQNLQNILYFHFLFSEAYRVFYSYRNEIVSEKEPERIESVYLLLVLLCAMH